jgi:hypothetical protein
VRLWYRLAVFTQTLDVELDCFADELLRFFSRLADRDTAGQIRHVSSYALATLFEDYEVFHDVASLSSSQPASEYFQVYQLGRPS